ncbi:MAG: hypothetical protein R3E89_13430 [Thiolinea sp.]
MNKALVLDFGGVISRTLFETHDSTEQALGLPPAVCNGAGRLPRSRMNSGRPCSAMKFPSVLTG